MRLLFSILNPVNFFYLAFHQPIAHISMKTRPGYFAKVFGFWLLLIVIFLIAILLNGGDIELALESYWLRIFTLLLIAQTLSVITIPLTLYRVYVTKDSVVQTWWFIKMVEVTYSDLFAIDISQEKNISSLHFFISDKLLGNIVMERIVSDVKTGFYFEPTNTFISEIMDTIPANKLSQNIINYPQIENKNDLREQIKNINDILLQRNISKYSYLALVVLHPALLFFIFEYFYQNIVISLLLSIALMPLVDLVRKKLGSILVSSYMDQEAVKKLYSNEHPVEQRIESFLKDFQSLKK